MQFTYYHPVLLGHINSSNFLLFVKIKPQCDSFLHYSLLSPSLNDSTQSCPARHQRDIALKTIANCKHSNKYCSQRTKLRLLCWFWRDKRSFCVSNVIMRAFCSLPHPLCMRRCCMKDPTKKSACTCHGGMDGVCTTVDNCSSSYCMINTSKQPPYTDYQRSSFSLSIQLPTQCKCDNDYNLCVALPLLAVYALLFGMIRW